MATCELRYPGTSRVLCLLEICCNFVNDLEFLFHIVDLKDRETLTDKELNDLWQTTKAIYFPDPQFLIGYRDEDVMNILRFYAQKQIKPEFLAFSERRKCNLSIVAREIYDKSSDCRDKSNRIDRLWNDEKSFWQLLFGYNKLYFKKQLDIEIYKLDGDYGDVQQISCI